MTKTLPAHGATIIFSAVPRGSYCSAGESYRVERPRNSGDFRFVRADTAGTENEISTYDAPWAVARAHWTVIDAR